jgi:hypothetical protein
MSDDKVIEFSNKVVTQIFEDIQASEDFGKAVSQLFTHLVLTSVAYTVEETIKFVKENPDVLEAEISTSEVVELEQK